MALELLDPQVETGGGTSDREFQWTLNFGPQHPATHTTMRFVLTLEGEKVVKAVPHIGYLHSGFEKLGEDLNLNQYVTIVDRMNYTSPLCNELAWHHVCEKALGIELTPRCKYIRTIINELMRIQDHLLNIGTCALDLGAFTAFLYAFYQRELIYDLCELASGQRFHSSYTRVGGLLYDIDDAWINKLRSFLKGFLKPYHDICGLLNRNKIFIDRLRGIGVLSKEEAISRSATGPIARASGVLRDLRKDEPYLAYKDFDFDVIAAREGDCLARYQVRLAEMLESHKIISQAIENLPSGPVNVDVDGKVILPDKSATWRSIEGMIQHFELTMTNRGFKAPVDEVYGAIEGPGGELGFYLVCDGTDKSWRCRTRPPAIYHLAMFPHLIEGHMLSDVVAITGSLSIIAAELDR
ncbi:MAG TPA: NADH-quinone oxidoreductase subunit D [Gemmatales bacterium]|nr:NADH-quinone oxidoreductase subunit D [Gemmatales bacterium]